MCPYNAIAMRSPHSTGGWSLCSSPSLFQRLVLVGVCRTSIHRYVAAMGSTTASPSSLPSCALKFPLRTHNQKLFRAQQTQYIPPMPRTGRDPNFVPYFQVSGDSSTRDCIVCLLCSANFLAAAFRAILRRPICPPTRLVRCAAGFSLHILLCCWYCREAAAAERRRRSAPPGDILTWLFRLVFASHMRRSRPITPRTAALTEETTTLSLPRTTGTWRPAISRSTRRCRRRRGERRELAHGSLLTNSRILPPHLPGIILE